MSVTKVIRYTTKSERAEENERLVRAVFAGLSQGSGEGLRYAVFRLEDGVSFVHVAVSDGQESSGSCRSDRAQYLLQRGPSDEETQRKWTWKKSSVRAQASFAECSW